MRQIRVIKPRRRNPRPATEAAALPAPRRPDLDDVTDLLARIDSLVEPDLP